MTFFTKSALSGLPCEATIPATFLESDSKCFVSRGVLRCEASRCKRALCGPDEYQRIGKEIFCPKEDRGVSGVNYAYLLFITNVLVPILMKKFPSKVFKCATRSNPITSRKVCSPFCKFSI